MSFNIGSLKANASACLNSVIVGGQRIVAEIQANPSEFLKTNAKTLIVATAFFTSFVTSPYLTVGACFGGFFYSKNVSKVEDELLNFMFNSSLETRCVSISMIALGTVFAGHIALPLAIGAHAGMLLSNRYESVAKEDKVLTTEKTDISPRFSEAQCS